MTDTFEVPHLETSRLKEQNKKRKEKERKGGVREECCGKKVVANRKYQVHSQISTSRFPHLHHVYELFTTVVFLILPKF